MPQRPSSLRVALLVCLSALSAVAQSDEVSPGFTVLITAARIGDVDGPKITADGRFVVYQSGDSDVVPSDTNERRDLYLYDRLTGATESVSVAYNGASGDADANRGAASADGRFVAFDSHATNLVADDANGVSDMFVRDRALGTTTRVSVSSDGTEGNGSSRVVEGFVISADGRYIVFDSDASNLASDDINGVSDVFLHDTIAHTTKRVSGALDDHECPSSHGGAVSPNGQFVVFVGTCLGGLYVFDNATGTTELITAEHAQGGVLSYDGQFVAYTQNFSEVFVFDRSSRVAHHLSSGARDTAISYDGRYVTFHADDSHAYVHDRVQGITERVDVGLDDVELAAPSHTISIDATGRYVAFVSSRPDLVTDDEDDEDIFVRDRLSESTQSDAFAGEIVSNDFYPFEATAFDPLDVAITPSVDGVVSIDEHDTTDTSPSGYVLLSKEVLLSAPAGTTDAPLRIVFRLDPSFLPAGQDQDTLTIFKNGEPVPACADSVQAFPDPCVAARRVTLAGDFEFEVWTTTASRWNFGVHEPFTFTGFMSPVENPPVLNVAQAGRTLPMKFSLGGDHGLHVIAADSPLVRHITCDGLAPTQMIDEATTAGGSRLTYDPATATYAYPWKTDKNWSGACRQFAMRLTDGSVHVANVRFAR